MHVGVVVSVSGPGSNPGWVLYVWSLHVPPLHEPVLSELFDFYPVVQKQAF